MGAIIGKRSRATPLQGPVEHNGDKFSYNQKYMNKIC